MLGPIRRTVGLLTAIVAIGVSVSCARHTAEQDVHSEHAAMAAGGATAAPMASDSTLPAGASDVASLGGGLKWPGSVPPLVSVSAVVCNAARSSPSPLSASTLPRVDFTKSASESSPV